MWQIVTFVIVLGTGQTGTIAGPQIEKAKDCLIVAADMQASLSVDPSLAKKGWKTRTICMRTA